MKELFAILTLLAVALWSYNLASLTPEVKTVNADAVYAVCMHSRTVMSKEWEQACGLVQDETFTEFKCDGVDRWEQCQVIYKGDISDEERQYQQSVTSDIK